MGRRSMRPLSRRLPGSPVNSTYSLRDPEFKQQNQQVETNRFLAPRLGMSLLFFEYQLDLQGQNLQGSTLRTLRDSAWQVLANGPVAGKSGVGGTLGFAPWDFFCVTR